MIIKCEHGYYKFFTTAPNELYRFKMVFGVELAPKEDYFTFAELARLEPYSLVNQPYGNLTAKATIAESYGELFKANGFVFDLTSGYVSFAAEQDINSVQTVLNLFKSYSGTLNLTTIPQAGGFYDGKRLISFSGKLDKFFKICEIWGAEYAEN